MPPTILRIVPTSIFNRTDPIVLGVEVVEGVAAVGTPLFVRNRDLGRITTIELNQSSVERATAGQTVVVTIECARVAYGRDFDFNDPLVGP